MMEAEDLGLVLHGDILLQQITFHVAPGAILALAGGSGVGKSLLAAALIGMLPPCVQRLGRVSLDGRAGDDAALRAARGSRIALAPQSLSSLDPSARIGDQLAWAARRCGLDTSRTGLSARVDAVLARFDLPAGIRNGYPHEVSGGMARRVLLGIATIGAPQVLIVDEPTNGLDGRNRERVADDLRRLAADGCAIILITHDLVFAAGLATSIGVLTDKSLAGPMPAHLFRGDGAAIRHATAQRLWRAMPANGMCADA